MMAAAAVPVTPHTASARKSRYRPEIDGLRAFAVVAVIINHFNKDLLPSGYLGVDIFFVISGYVITSSLADRKSKNVLDFLTGFYERRIKRLVPALVVFVLLTSILISLFNPEPNLELIAGGASLFGLSNLFLLVQSVDYFAVSTELNPFAHTWSLGVEEQFYLLFPFLIWFSGFGQQKSNGARNLFFWVGALSLASVISFIVLYQVNQPAAYFLMPPRFWEMAAGCLIFIAFQKRAKIEQALEQVPPLLAVAAMVGVMFLPSEAAVPATISIVVLSAILVACLKKGTAAYDFFTLKKVVYVGLISYSLYLWHWGVLCISRWTIGIYWWSVPFQVLIMLSLAILSYELVEKTLRHRSWNGRSVVAVLQGLALLLSALGVVVWINKSHFRLLNIGGKLLGPEKIKDVGIIQSRIHCHLPRQSLDAIRECLGGPRSRAPIIYIIGDSHASNHYPSIKDAVLHLAGQPQVRVLVDWGLVQWLRGRDYCGSYNPCIKNSWEKHRDFFARNIHRGDVVVFSIWRDKVVQRRNQIPREVDDDKVNILGARLREMVSVIEPKGGKIVLVDDTPMVCEPGINFQHFVLRMGQFEKCSVAEQVSLKDRIGLTSLYKNLVVSRPNTIHYFDPHPALCFGGICDAFDRRRLERRILYGDGMGHFRSDYANPLASEWKSLLTRLLGYSN